VRISKTSGIAARIFTNACGRCFFLYALHRFHLPTKAGMKLKGLVPFKGYNHLLRRRFEEALEVFLAHASGRWSQ